MGKYFTIAFWITFYSANNGMTFKVLASLFIISFTESCCFVIPPDFLLPLLAIDKPLGAIIFLTLFTTLASVIGAAFGYFIGKKGGQPLVDRLFKKEKVDKVETLFQKYDVWAIGIAAFTPIPYKVFTIMAGVFDLHFIRFLIVSLFARGTRYMLISMISYMLLKNMTANEVIDYLHGPEFKLLTLAIAGGVIVLYLVYRLIMRSRRKAAAPAS